MLMFFGGRSDPIKALLILLYGFVAAGIAGIMVCGRRSDGGV
jgi:hypothetical protein